MLAAALTSRPQPVYVPPAAGPERPPLAEAVDEASAAPAPPPYLAPVVASSLAEAPELQLPIVLLSLEENWYEAPAATSPALTTPDGIEPDGIEPEGIEPERIEPERIELDVATDFPLDLTVEAVAAVEAVAEVEAVEPQREPEPAPSTESLVELAEAVRPDMADEAIRSATEHVRPRDRFVAFECAGRLYGLPLERVAEVERVPHLTAVPGAPQIMCGLINRRGDIVPLIDLRLMLGGSSSDDPHAGRLVMAAPEPGEESLAFLVDRLAGLASIERSEIGPASAGSQDQGSSCLAGRATHRGRELLVLDSSALREETHRCFAI
jgi:purine-binding chemotaxis protein CheW